MDNKERQDVEDFLNSVKNLCNLVCSDAPAKSKMASSALMLGHDPWVLNPHLFPANIGIEHERAKSAKLLQAAKRRMASDDACEMPFDEDMAEAIRAYDSEGK